MEIQSADALLDRTYKLLSARKLSLKDIAKEADLDESWLAKFHRKAIPNPGVNLVQKLHDHLLNKQSA